MANLVMENSNEDLKNIVEKFRQKFYYSTPDIQLQLVVPILSASNGYVKWRLKSWISGIETSDMFTLLPPELQLIVLSYLDDDCLLNACLVSKEWNKTITSHEGLWRKRALIIGVEFNHKPEHISWYSAFTKSRKQIQFLKSGNAFRERYIKWPNCHTTIKAVDYKDGYMCIASDDLICIWNLELNMPVINFKVDRGQGVSCIKFNPKSILVCGHFCGNLTSWNLSGICDDVLKPLVINSSDLETHIFQLHSGPVFSCDFSEDLDLLVSGSADKNVKFWCLSSGCLLYTIGEFSHWVLRVVLMPYNSDNSSHSIIVMTRDTANKYCWSFPADPIDEKADKKAMLRGVIKEIKLFSDIKLNENNDNFITPGLQLSSKFVGLVKQDLQEKQANFVLIHKDTFKPFHTIPIDFRVRKLIALGNKFGILMTVGKVLNCSTLVIFDIMTGKSIGTQVIPHSKMTTPDGAQVIVGDTKWLDGLRGWDLFRGKQFDESLDVEDVFESLISESNIDEEHNSEDNTEILNYYLETKFKTHIKMRQSSSVFNSLVLAAGVQSEKGKVLTLWWKDVNENFKHKEE